MSRSKTSWKRWPELIGKFPEKKYGWTENLPNLGDYVQTHKISSEEYHKLRYAAYIWAWKHRCRVKVQAFRQLGGGYKVRVTLVDMNRERDFS
jgi:hypothetical protein